MPRTTCTGARCAPKTSHQATAVPGVLLPTTASPKCWAPAVTPPVRRGRTGSRKVQKKDVSPRAYRTPSERPNVSARLRHSSERPKVSHYIPAAKTSYSTAKKMLPSTTPQCDASSSARQHLAPGRINRKSTNCPEHAFFSPRTERRRCELRTHPHPCAAVPICAQPSVDEIGGAKKTP